MRPVAYLHSKIWMHTMWYTLKEKNPSSNGISEEAKKIISIQKLELEKVEKIEESLMEQPR